MLRRIGILVLALAVAVGAWAWRRVGQLDVLRLTDDIWVLSGVGGNVGVLITSAGVVVVDTMTFVRQGAAIQAQIRELTSQPIVAVINTHYHLDHTHGNPAFPPGTKVVSTTRTLQHLQTLDAKFWADPPARDLLPNQTFDGSWEFTVGGKTVRAYHMGRGHTDGDLVVLFVDERVLQAGDLFFNGYWPNIDLEAGGSVADWPATMDEVQRLDWIRVIPGHGPVSNREGFRQFRDFMASLWTQTKAVVERGGTRADADREVDLERFQLHRLWFAPQLSRSLVVSRAFEEASRR